MASSPFSFIAEVFCGICTPAMLLCTGLVLSVGCRIWKLCMPRRFFRTLWDIPPESRVTPFRAVTMALAGTLGVGNITGVSAAIVQGGPGAVFWMWIGALLSLAVKYGEVVLAVKYRHPTTDGYRGGTMFTLRDGYGKTRLGGLFALFCIANALVTGNLLQSNAAAAVLAPLPRWSCGLILVFLTLLALRCGIHRLSEVTLRLIPGLCAVYIIASLAVIGSHVTYLPEILAEIVSCAFSTKAVVGGTVGWTIREAVRFGITRGIFSNEAGCGTSPTSHAAADTKSPHHQGMYGIFEVFCDTIVLCTMTALVLLIAEREYGILSWGGDNMTLLAFGLYGGKFLYGVLALSVVLFAYATILAQLYYGDTAIRYFGEHKWARRSFVAGMLCVTMVGAVADASVLWRIADVLVCVMTTVNTAFLFGRRREIGESARMGMLEVDEKAG